MEEIVSHDTGPHSPSIEEEKRDGQDSPRQPTSTGGDRKTTEVQGSAKQSDETR